MGRYGGLRARLAGMEWREREGMPMFGRMDVDWLPRNPWMRRSLIAGIVLYGWTIFGILSSAHFFMGEESATGSASLEDIAGHVLLFYWAWAAVTPLVLIALRRAVEARADARRRWSTIVLATPAVIVIHGALYLTAVRIFGLKPATAIGGAELRDYAMRHTGGDIATVVVLVAVYLLFDARRKAHAREVAATALEARVAAADLEVLRWQLQPHFLFNALNTVSTLVLRGDNIVADDAIGRISRYLRTALAQRGDALVTLDEELQNVREYFGIERLRFGDALCLDVRLEPGTRAVRVPAMIVQPLLENAIRHGLSPAHGSTRVGIDAAIVGGWLQLRVIDPAGGGGGGAGASKGDDALGEGFGLRYVRDRLRHFYGEDASVALATSPGETIVTVVVPVAPTGSRSA